MILKKVAHILKDKTSSMLVFMDNLQLFDTIDANKVIGKDVSVLGKLEININSSCAKAKITHKSGNSCNFPIFHCVSLIKLLFKISKYKIINIKFPK